MEAAEKNDGAFMICSCELCRQWIETNMCETPARWRLAVCQLLQISQKCGLLYQIFHRTVNELLHIFLALATYLTLGTCLLFDFD